MIKYNWLTCPFCNEYAKRYKDGDISFSDLDAWECMNEIECHITFYTRKEDNTEGRNDCN